MNRNLKLAVTAAVAAMGMAGQAHALTNSDIASSSNPSGSLFLFAFEDRQTNTLATNSAIFDLGLASAFNTASNQTFDFSANSAWTTYINSIATPANIHWGVFGVSTGVGATGTKILTTMSTVPTSVNGTALSSATVNYNAEIDTYGDAACGSGCGFSVVTPNDLASTKWDDTAGVAHTMVLTTGLGSNMNFYQYTSNGTKASSLATQAAFATAGDADYFTLSNTGVLTYTATAVAVPEAETYAMMLAGLGLVGFMVRRRAA